MKSALFTLPPARYLDGSPQANQRQAPHVQLTRRRDRIAPLSLRTGWILRSRISSLFLDSSVCFLNLDRSARRANGLFKHAALGCISLVLKGLHLFVTHVFSEIPAIGALVLFKSEFGKLCHIHKNSNGSLSGRGIDPDSRVLDAA